MPNPISRRQFVQGGAAAAFSATAAGCAGDDEAPVIRPEGVPVSDFNDESTTDEVLAGIDLSGKNILITGGNSGLGFESMRALTARGAHVLCVARTQEKAEEACAGIEGRTTPLTLDLADFESIVACARQVQRMGIELDVLMCNAGIMALPELEQVNGIERQFVVNHLGHFILVNNLLEQVKAARQGRVVVVSSSGYMWAPEAGIEFDNLSGEREYEPNKMYGQSKLANGLFSLELSRRLEGYSATANSLHPGIINTNLGRHFPKWQLFMADLIGWTFMKSIPAGAATQCYLAAAPGLAETSGAYFEDCNPVVPGNAMLDQALATRLWDASVDLTRDYLPG